MKLTWDDLPRDIRLLILEALMQDGCTLCHLAIVSREWQTVLELLCAFSMYNVPCTLEGDVAFLRLNNTL
jgi:hypothetical protein